jgi:hypothetical protein
MKPLNRFSLIILAFVLLSLGGCNQREGWEGRYRAEIQEGDQLRLVTLELGINGQGTWKAEGDQVSFRWEVSDAKIRLHTREGGVLLGTVEEKIIALTLPEMPPLTFRKMVR